MAASVENAAKMVLEAEELHVQGVRLEDYKQPLANKIQSIITLYQDQ